MLQRADSGGSGEYVDYDDWIIIDDSKQNFVAKPFHVDEVRLHSTVDCRFCLKLILETTALRLLLTVVIYCFIKWYITNANTKTWAVSYSISLFTEKCNVSAVCTDNIL